MNFISDLLTSIRVHNTWLGYKLGEFKDTNLIIILLKHKFRENDITFMNIFKLIRANRKERQWKT